MQALFLFVPDPQPARKNGRPQSLLPYLYIITLTPLGRAAHFYPHSLFREGRELDKALYFYFFHRNTVPFLAKLSLAPAVTGSHDQGRSQLRPPSAGIVRPQSETPGSLLSLLFDKVCEGSANSSKRNTVRRTPLPPSKNKNREK